MAAKVRKKKKKEFLPNNKALFKKLLMPKSAYLEKIRIGEMDVAFLILVFLLLVIGLIMMYSASYAWAISADLPQDYYFKRQLSMALIGLAAMIILSSKLFDYHMLKHPAINFPFFLLCIFFMVIVHVGSFVNSTAEAERWVDLGFFSFQPSELMKMGLIMMLAHLMASNRSNRHTIKYGAVPYLALIGAVALLALWQRHLSGAIIMCLIAVLMLFVSGTDMKNVAFVCIAGVLALGAGVYGLYKLGKFDYISERVLIWRRTFDPEIEQSAWQTRNSLIAIGSGGLMGLGLGNSRQKFLYLPESKNDFVFSIVCEELGFFGALVVIILFLTLIFRGFKIASSAPDKYGMLLASGIVIQIGLQAMLNIAVVSNTIPNTGISLPFFSYGGSALIMQLAEMGVVLNVSRQSIPNKGRPDADDAAKEHEMKQAAQQQSEAPVRRSRKR